MEIRKKLLISDIFLLVALLFPIMFYFFLTSQQVSVLKSNLRHAESVNNSFMELSEIKRRMELSLYQLQIAQEEDRARDLIRQSEEFRRVILRFRSFETDDYLLEGFVDRYVEAELKIVASYLELAALELSRSSSRAWPIRNQLTLLEPVAIVHKTDLSNYLNNIIFEYTSESRLRRDEFLRLSMVSLLFAVMIVLLRYRFVRLGVLKPLTSLLFGLRRIREGRDVVRLAEFPDSPEVNEVIQSFNELSDSLEYNRQYREIFSAITAHDLKEPLGAIMSLAHLRQFEAEQGGATDEGDDALLRIQSNAKVALNMIDGLLQLSRSSFQEIAYEEIQLDELLERVFQELQTFYFNRNAEIKIGSLGVLRGDARQIETLFRNLISNSIKFSKPDKNGVLIEVFQSHHEVDGTPFKNIHVRDNGVGFNMQDYSRLLQPFESGAARQTGNSSDSKHTWMRGVGLGLAVCQRIVENHRGSFVANSEPNVGSEFILSFPDTDTQSLQEIQRSNRRNFYSI